MEPKSKIPLISQSLPALAQEEKELYVVESEEAQYAANHQHLHSLGTQNIVDLFPDANMEKLN